MLAYMAAEALGITFYDTGLPGQSRVALRPVLVLSVALAQPVVPQRFAGVLSACSAVLPGHLMHHCGGYRHS